MIIDYISNLVHNNPLRILIQLIRIQSNHNFIYRFPDKIKQSLILYRFNLYIIAKPLTKHVQTNLAKMSNQQQSKQLKVLLNDINKKNPYVQELQGSYKSHYAKSKNVVFYDGDQEMHTRGGKGPDSGQAAGMGQGNAGGGQQQYLNPAQQPSQQYGMDDDPYDQPLFLGALNDRPNLENVLQDIEQAEKLDRRANPRGLQKEEDVFDLEMNENDLKQQFDNDKTAGEFLDADFNDTGRQFSFNNGGTALNKHISMLNADQFSQPRLSSGSFHPNRTALRSRPANRNSGLLAEPNDPIDDSLNDRLSVPSREASSKYGTQPLFNKGSSNQESQQDLVSGHFQIKGSPQMGQTLGREKKGQNNNNDNQNGMDGAHSKISRALQNKLQNPENKGSPINMRRATPSRSPNQQVYTLKPPQKDNIKPSILQNPDAAFSFDPIMGDVIAERDREENRDDFDMHDTQA